MARDQKGVQWGDLGWQGGLLSGPGDGECGDDLLESPAVVWHSYTMTHHHLSLVAMPTTLLQNRHVLIKYARAILLQYFPDVTFKCPYEKQYIHLDNVEPYMFKCPYCFTVI